MGQVERVRCSVLSSTSLTFVHSHPGMVCLCGRTISENLVGLLAIPEPVLSYHSWQTFSSTHLHDRAYGYVTFRTMINSLLKEEATPAVSLLRSHFAGFLDPVYLINAQQTKQADFLTAEGVLLRSAPHYYHMASAIVDGLIRRYVIPEKFPCTPPTHPPMVDERLHILDVLSQVAQVFR
jgi:hypothetical protein